MTDPITPDRLRELLEPGADQMAQIIIRIKGFLHESDRSPGAKAQVFSVWSSLLAAVADSLAKLAQDAEVEYLKQTADLLQTNLKMEPNLECQATADDVIDEAVMRYGISADIEDELR